MRSAHYFPLFPGRVRGQGSTQGHPELCSHSGSGPSQTFRPPQNTATNPERPGRDKNPISQALPLPGAPAQAGHHHKGPGPPRGLQTPPQAAGSFSNPQFGLRTTQQHCSTEAGPRVSYLRIFIFSM